MSDYAALMLFWTVLILFGVNSVAHSVLCEFLKHRETMARIRAGAPRKVKLPIMTTKMPAQVGFTRTMMGMDEYDPADIKAALDGLPPVRKRGRTMAEAEDS